MKTTEQIEKLKKDWCHDPCWDIEDTEGFEDHRDELLLYSEKCEKQWNDKETARIEKKAKEIGVNTKTMKTIEGLECQFENEKQKAVKLFVHYFKYACPHWEYDNSSEIECAVDSLINAATANTKIWFLENKEKL